MVMLIIMVVMIVIDLQEPYMNDISDIIPITNQFVKEGLVVGMVGKQRKYSMEQADIPNIRYWNKFFIGDMRI